ncbi:MAG: hypothetical protein Q9227_005737 [Pyrenula ochraceoflavens]
MPAQLQVASSSGSTVRASAPRLNASVKRHRSPSDDNVEERPTKRLAPNVREELLHMDILDPSNWELSDETEMEYEYTDHGKGKAKATAKPKLKPSKKRQNDINAHLGSFDMTRPARGIMIPRMGGAQSTGANDLATDAKKPREEKAGNGLELSSASAKKDQQTTHAVVVAAKGATAFAKAKSTARKTPARQWRLAVKDGEDVSDSDRSSSERAGVDNRTASDGRMGESDSNDAESGVVGALLDIVDDSARIGGKGKRKAAGHGKAAGKQNGVTKSKTTKTKKHVTPKVKARRGSEDDVGEGDRRSNKDPLGEKQIFINKANAHDERNAAIMCEGSVCPLMLLPPFPAFFDAKQTAISDVSQFQVGNQLGYDPDTDEESDEEPGFDNCDDNGAESDSVDFDNSGTESDSETAEIQYLSELPHNGAESPNTPEFGAAAPEYVFTPGGVGCFRRLYDRYTNNASEIPH